MSNHRLAALREMPDEASNVEVGERRSKKPDASGLAIQARSIRLEYPLGAFDKGSIKESIFSLLGGGRKNPPKKYVAAIRDVSFRFAFGERVALIGHNGSGKSSLLRILAGIFPLSAGEVVVTGRIGTLLDISLGFESEATGRENIYYRGMTLGYSRADLQKIEHEIVQFADLGEFIDLPMRTYSAGMFVRLGFAISTQFAPDILLVDEVFSAGDASFANKALQRMMAIVARSGILVMATHDLALVESVCTRVIWLERGEVFRDGPPSSIVPEYMRYMSEQ